MITALETTEITNYGNTTKTVYSDAFGRVTKEETKNGDTVVLLKEYEYTANGDYTTEQIKSVKTTVGSSAPEITRYAYDNNGNITEIYSKVGNNAETTVATYEYDELNQLVKENNKNYVYDNYGNIISAGNNSYSYSTGEWKDQLTSFNGDAITYDEGGNPLNYMGATLTWEKGRQLKSYSKDNLSITYKYNTDGLRTEKNVNGTVYSYVWRDSKLVHQSGGNKNIHFYYDATDSIIGFEYAGDNYTYIKNIQGDIVGILDESGNAVATYTYDAWGNILTATGNLAEINPIRYRGYYYDDEINMYYLQSRYYDQNIGRFINIDNLKYLVAYYKMFMGNIYTYCKNNFVNFVDYNGEWVLGVAYLNVNIYGLNNKVYGTANRIVYFGWVEDYRVTLYLLRNNIIIGSKFGVNNITISSFTTQTAYWQLLVSGYYGDTKIYYQTHNILLNKKGVEYPKYTDKKAKKTAFKPPLNLKVIPVNKRVKWTTSERNKYRKWYEKTYNNGNPMNWKGLHIHHIIPRKYGGTNKYSNLIVLPAAVHTLFTIWWASY